MEKLIVCKCAKNRINYKKRKEKIHKGDNFFLHAPLRGGGLCLAGICLVLQFKVWFMYFGIGFPILS